MQDLNSVTQCSYKTKSLWNPWIEDKQSETNVSQQYKNKLKSKKDVVNNVDKSSWRAPWQISPYKNKHIEQQQTINLFPNVCVFDMKTMLCLHL